MLEEQFIAPSDGASSGVAAPIQPHPELPISFTLVEAGKTKTLSKQFWLEGDKIKKQSADLLYSGKARHKSIHFKELPTIFENATSHQALVLGCYDSEKFGSEVRLSTKKNVNIAQDLISRSKDYFGFPKGPGLTMLDHDPSEHGRAFSSNELIDELAEIIPSIKSAAHIVRGSVSAGVHRPDQTPDFAGRGFHMYFPVKDASMIEGFAKAVEGHLWLNGLGFIALARNGAMLGNSQKISPSNFHQSVTITDVSYGDNFTYQNRNDQLIKKTHHYD